LIRGWIPVRVKKTRQNKATGKSPSTRQKAAIDFGHI
jgi:hypothetical protein